MDAKSSSHAVAAAVTAILSGCALSHSAAPSGYSFAYQADNREEIGLVQVFDDGAQTYLQLPAAGDAATRVIDEKGQTTTPIRNGAFLMVPGVHSALTLERAEGVSHINRQGGLPHLASKADAQAVPATAHPAALPIAVPAGSASEDPAAPGRPIAGAPPQGPSAFGGDLAGMQAMVSQLKSEVQALEREIADEQEALEQTRQLLARETRTETFVIHFANNSARAQLSEEEIASIVNVGKNAQSLIIEGYTDAFYANAAGAHLARARAQNVAEVLTQGGLKREVMNIEFHAAGGFARENTTDEGRAFNRRVAISFRFPETISSG